MVAEIRRFSNYGRVVLKAWVRESPAPDFNGGLNIDPGKYDWGKAQARCDPLEFVRVLRRTHGRRRSS
jgi:hypothetical protein